MLSRKAPFPLVVFLSAKAFTANIFREGFFVTNIVAILINCNKEAFYHLKELSTTVCFFVISHTFRDIGVIDKSK